MTSPRDEVALLAEALQKGETSRDLCPKCRGGTSKEKSFCVSRDETGRVYYNCFRAKCGFKGQIVTQGQWKNARQAYKVKEFKYDLFELLPAQVDSFKRTYDLDLTNHIYWVRELGAYAHRVLGPQGQFRGWMVRRYGIDRFDCAYPARDTEPFIHWVTPDAADGAVVVVEDILSALKVAQAGYKACALCGTMVGFDRAYEIAANTEGGVNLALDKGTLELMIRYRTKFEPIWGKVNIWSLDKDLKYVDITRIKKAVVDGEYDFNVAI